MHPICVMVQGALKPLVDSKYEGNIRKAAKYLGVEYNLAYRILHGLQKNLAFFEAFRLVKALGISPDGAVLREFYPKEYADATKIGGDQASIDETFKALDWALSMPLHFEVLTYCSEIRNVDETKISHEFGSRGAAALKDLIIKKLVEVGENGMIRSKLSKNHWAPHSICMKHANANLSLLRLEIPGSYIRTHAKGLNDRGLVAYYKAYRGFEETLCAIEDEEEYAGDSLVVSGLYMGPVSNNDKEGGV